MIALAASGPGPARTGLSICIPVYNERDAIAETLRRCLALKPALESVGVRDLEVIAVDDGSKDGSAEAIAEFPQVRLIRHQVNRGYGAALKTGFAAASHELVGFLDGDATYPPEQFPNLVREIIEDRADLVIGSRLAGAETEMPLIRRVGNMFFARLLTIIGRSAVSDSASGMRVFRKSTLELLSPLPDGLNLTPVMSTRAVHERIRVVERPIPYSERQGESKLSVAGDGLRFLSTIVWTALTYNPVRILGIIGLAGVGVAVAVALGADRGADRRRRHARPDRGLQRVRGAHLRRRRRQHLRARRRLQLPGVAVPSPADPPGPVQAAAAARADRAPVPAGRHRLAGGGRGRCRE